MIFKRSSVADELGIQGATAAVNIRKFLLSSGIKVSDDELSKIYLEVIFLEVHVFDKLMSNKKDSKTRQNFTNKLFDELKIIFFQADIISKGYSSSDFEMYLKDAFYSYPHQAPIIAPIYGEIDVISHFISRISSLLNNNLENVKFVFYEIMEQYIQSLFTLKSVKKLKII